jgi:Ca2+-binding RTX toxin-like protein
VLFETLETRRLMSVTFSVVSGVLTVDGSTGPDGIMVVDQSQAPGRLPGDVDIIVQDLVDTSQPDLTTHVPGVTAGIVLNLGAGRDVTSVAADVDVVINGGDGDDVLTAFNSGAAFAVYGGNGADVIDVYDYADVGTIAMGNGNDDTITISKSSSSIGSPTAAYGGNGDDHITGEVPEGADLIIEDNGIDPPRIVGIVYNDAVFGHARLYGGNGRDTLISYHEQTVIDGENGKDIEEYILPEDATRIDMMNVK